MEKKHTNLTGPDVHPARGVSKVFQNVAQNEEVLIPHISDPSGLRTVQLFKGIAGGTGLINNSLDFDLVDESQFIQEDAVDGTDFADGVVTLHDDAPSTVASLTEAHPNYPISGGNHIIGTLPGTGSQQSAFTDMQMNSGEFYFEVEIGDAMASAGTSIGIGLFIASMGVSDSLTGPYIIVRNGNTYFNGSTTWNPGFVAGDILGFDFRANTGILSLYVNGVFISSYAGVSTGQLLKVGVYSYYSSNTPIDLLFNFDKNNWNYAPRDAIFVEMAIGISSYPIAGGYYITTSDQNHIDLGDIAEITALNIDYSEPASTLLRALVSFDGRATWKTTTGGIFEDHIGVEDTVNTNLWATIPDLIAALVSRDITNDQTLDFAFLLDTGDASASPSVNSITLTYTAFTDFIKASESDYEVIEEDSVTTKVKRLAANSESLLKVNIVL